MAPTWAVPGLLLKEELENKCLKCAEIFVKVLIVFVVIQLLIRPLKKTSFIAKVIQDGKDFGAQTTSSAFA